MTGFGITDADIPYLFSSQKKKVGLGAGIRKYF
jgi:hypothetical protein